MIADKFPIYHKRPNSIHLYLEFCHPEDGTILTSELNITEYNEHIIRSRIHNLKICLRRIDIFEVYTSYPKWLWYKDKTFEEMISIISTRYKLSEWGLMELNTIVDVLSEFENDENLVIDWPWVPGTDQLYILNDMTTTKVSPTGKEEIFKIKIIR